MSSVSARRRASTRHGTLVSCAVSPSTGTGDAEGSGFDLGAWHGGLRGEHRDHRGQIAGTARGEGADWQSAEGAGRRVRTIEKRLGPADIAREKHRAITLQLTSRTFSSHLQDRSVQPAAISSESEGFPASADRPATSSVLMA